MKKSILSIAFLLLLGLAHAQNNKIQVAVAFDMDTNFTLLGPLTTKTLEIDLTGNLYKHIEMLNDTASFQLKRVELPEEYRASNNPSMSGIPQMNLLTSWVKGLRKKQAVDLLLIVYKPVRIQGVHSTLQGFSYGINTGKNFVFSLNDALVFDVRSMKILAATSIESESDYLAGTFELDKSLPFDNQRNLETPIEMINKLQQDFALKVFQCMLVSKRRLSEGRK
jgi:hypothetical protein